MALRATRYGGKIAELELHPLVLVRRLCPAPAAADLQGPSAGNDLALGL